MLGIIQKRDHAMKASIDTGRHDDVSNGKAALNSKDDTPTNETLAEDWEAISDTFSVISINSAMLIEEEIETHYDEKSKKWVFRDDRDAINAAEMLVPPPGIPKNTELFDVKAPALDDPVAALMVPPPNRFIQLKNKGTISLMGSKKMDITDSHTRSIVSPLVAVFQPRPASQTELAKPHNH